MSTLLWLLCWIGTFGALAYHRASLMTATITIGALLILTTFLSPLSWFTLLILWGLFGASAFFLNHPDYKREFIFQRAFDALSKTLPTMSETERVALEAGTVSWDGELFSGEPQWEKLLTIPAPKLSEEEQAFVDGPVNELCEMVNDWEITHTDLDLPPHVWDYLKEKGFFALMIPKKYGGKGFSEFAHSEILTILSSRSLTLACTVSVPNSLGPAELLLHYGTPAQRDYYLPRLASGEDIPCFALTAPDAGSDAGAITDSGIICQGIFEGKEVLGIKLNWNKRYITLAPIATLLGLAFKLYDPHHLVGDKEELGITCALIPTNLPGITIGRRHLPSSIPFQNGPTQGKDVFIPLDGIIGGIAMAGQGWRMLVECLSTGRAISLPSISVGSARMASLTAGAYSRIRRQFRTAIANFEGIQEVLARIAGFTYMADATRYLTVAMVNAGEKPSVPGAIAKYHVTELARRISNDAMDVHGGKGIMMGPKNYLCRAYQGIPIAITVEGANILTRNMIIFGQGAIRCHPFLLKEMQALTFNHFPDFEHYFSEHIRYTLSNAARSFFHGLTMAKFASSPTTNETKIYFQRLTQASSAFALVADATLALVGGKLKFKESLSARLGDMLAMMYIMSALLKRYQDQNSPQEDLPLLIWSLNDCLATFWHTLNELLANLPNPWVARGLRLLTMPWGQPRFAQNDKLNRQVAEMLTSTNATKTRLVENSFISNKDDDSIHILQKAFQETLLHEELLKRLYNGSKGSLEQAIKTATAQESITSVEANALLALANLYQSVIAVDDFGVEEL